VIAADSAGEFVFKGFQSLKVLSDSTTRPFSQDRAGFFIAEASACFLVSNHQEEGGFHLAGVGVDAEGYTVTRPSPSGTSLKRAIAMSLKKNPDVVIAHATATKVNDAVEDNIFYDLFFHKNLKPLITSTKWCVGHSLAVSGALDVIAGCEILKNKKLFSIATTTVKDPQFRGEYLLASAPIEDMNFPLENFLVTSLGFGGLHGAAFIEKAAL
jgi:3-oxoacyl-(acyl-carrier-protein) synthase